MGTETRGGRAATETCKQIRHLILAGLAFQGKWTSVGRHRALGLQGHYLPDLHGIAGVSSRPELSAMGTRSRGSRLSWMRRAVWQAYASQHGRAAAPLSPAGLCSRFP